MSLLDLWQHNAVAVTITALVVGAAVTAAIFTWVRRHGRESESGARLFYLVCVMCTAISANTSWRFFGGVLHIDNVAERAAMFAVLETALVACGYAMRANVRQSASGDATAGPRPQPGAPRMVAWVLAGLAGYMAVAESGLGEGIARVALGPVLGIVSLHLALGIELRQRHGEATSTAARVLAELRERVLSVLGIADEQRDALERIRDRNARRAARLALAPSSPRRDKRLQKALRKSGVAHDPGETQRLLAELAVLRHAAELADLDQPSPWMAGGHEKAATADTVVTMSDTQPDTTLPPDTAANVAERTPDTTADTETDTTQTAVLPVTTDMTASGGQQPEMETAPSASTPPEPQSDQPEPDDGDETDAQWQALTDAAATAAANGLDTQDIQDERVQIIVGLLQEGDDVNGRIVAERFDCSDRTGRRLIKEAERALRAGHRRQLEVVAD